jgi:hypothetical protein
MKCLACRSSLPGYPGDIEDIRFLLKKMGIRALRQVEEQIERFYPYDALTPEACGTIEKLIPKGDHEEK